VCARINASDEPPKQVSDTTRRPATAVVELWERLRHNELSGVRTDLLHGQMTPDAKDDTMRRFAAGAIDVLVSTTVIEVGVDVPNATVMVVMDADWFGVSQLHQLRGRVGRGSEPSLCLLVTHVAGGPVRDRLDAVAKTLDGFKLSEIDLRQRREGDLLGAAQSGTKRSLMLSVLDDVQVIEDAREAAIATVDADAELADHPALAEAVAEVTADVRADYLERS
jgi:ATP-dependent DNA helicase RecG